MLNKSADLFFYQWQYRKLVVAARKVSALSKITVAIFYQII